jgi:hypothetical protein
MRPAWYQIDAGLIAFFVFSKRVYLDTLNLLARVQRQGSSSLGSGKSGSCVEAKQWVFLTKDC